jgi:PAS domain-containing protein
VRQAADIIERHKAEDALRESEEWLRLAQSRTGIGVWDRNLRTGKLALTPELEAIFGLKPGNVKCYADFRALVHPDDIDPYEAERDAGGAAPRDVQGRVSRHPTGRAGSMDLGHGRRLL